MWNHIAIYVVKNGASWISFNSGKRIAFTASNYDIGRFATSAAAVNSNGDELWVDAVIIADNDYEMWANYASSPLVFKSITDFIVSPYGALLAALGVGEQHKFWQSCIFEQDSTSSKLTQTDGSSIINNGSTDFYFLFRCPLQTVKGMFRLHIDMLIVSLRAAGAGDYIDHIVVGGNTRASTTTIHSDATNKTSPDTVYYKFTATDCGDYTSVGGYIQVVCTTFNTIKINDFLLRCWYDL